MLPRTDEQGPARQRLSVIEHHQFEQTILSLEASHRLFPDLDTLTGELFPVLLAQAARPAGAEHEVAGPDREAQGKGFSVFGSTINGDRLIAPFPTIAVGTVVHACSVESLESVQNRELIHHSGGQKQFPGGDLTPVTADDSESIG